MKVAFRVDASKQIGTGHLMRCLTLADALKQRGTQVRFVSRHMPDHLRNMLIAKGHEFTSLNGISNEEISSNLSHAHWLSTSQCTDARETVQALSDLTWDWLIVDHYALDSRWETTLRNTAKGILVIDDIADRDHDCDVLLDQNLYADMETRYTDKVPPHCQLLLGPHYALLREEFRSLRHQANPRTGPIKRILIFFGGVDAENDTSPTIATIAGLGVPELHVDVVIGALHPFREQIESACDEHGFVCHVQTTRMAELMVAADLTIGAGGTTTYERIYLRLPGILKAVAPNQVAPLNSMSRMGLFDLFTSQNELENRLRELFKHGVSSPPDCVEDGTNKLLEIMVAEFVRFRLPETSDVMQTFRWLQDKKLRDDFMISKCPDLPEHFDYWRKLLTDSGQRVYSILHLGQHVGNCGLKNINDENHTSELWIYLGELSVRNRGIGHCAVLKLLSIARNDLSGISVYLHVAKTNDAAIHLYKKSGFYELKRPLTGRWSGRDSEMLCMECQL